MKGVILLFVDYRGIHIPYNFATEIDHKKFTGYEWEDVNTLKRIWRKNYEDMDIDDNQIYWDTWDRILTNAELRDHMGNTWKLTQDGDVFLYCPKLMDREEYMEFFGLDEEEDLEEE